MKRTFSIKTKQEVDISDEELVNIIIDMMQNHIVLYKFKEYDQYNDPIVEDTKKALKKCFNLK